MTILYLLMRTDLPSLNSGKGMAQAHHAGTHLSYHYEHRKEYKEWANQARGFGTVLTVGATESMINLILKEYKYKGDITGKIIDPTYPIRDGYVTHYVSCMTCAYILSHDLDHPGYKHLCMLELHK